MSQATKNKTLATKLITLVIKMIKADKVARRTPPEKPYLGKVVSFKPTVLSSFKSRVFVEMEQEAKEVGASLIDLTDDELERLEEELLGTAFWDDDYSTYHQGGKTYYRGQTRIVTKFVKRTFTNPTTGEKSDEWMANSIRANDDGTPWTGRNKSPQAYWVHGDYLAGFRNMVVHHAQNIAERKLAEQKKKKKKKKKNGAGRARGGQPQPKRQRGRPKSAKKKGNGDK
jgi:hypothetical protein